MKNKLVKKILVTTLATGMILSSNVAVTHAAYIADVVFVTADKSVKGNGNSGYYATGWVSCPPSHYTTAKLENKKTGTYVKTSQRKKGKGKVSASTGKTAKYAYSALGARVFYDWA